MKPQTENTHNMKVRPVHNSDSSSLRAGFIRKPVTDILYAGLLLLSFILIYLPGTIYWTKGSSWSVGMLIQICDAIVLPGVLFLFILTGMLPLTGSRDAFESIRYLLQHAKLFL